MPIAIVTGGSRGLGKALAGELVRRSWSVIIDARNETELAAAHNDVAAAAGNGAGTLVALAGDVNDPAHRHALVEAAEQRGGLDLLVNNASTLGETPLPHLALYSVEELASVFETNVISPLALVQEALPLLRSSPRPAIINVTSDASVEHYEGWGGYAAAKAALDHVSGTLAAENPALRVYAVDPGDMRTQMHQDAFPGEDISDRPLPEESLPGFVALIEGELPSGRYRASEVAKAPLVEQGADR